MTYKPSVRVRVLFGWVSLVVMLTLWAGAGTAPGDQNESAGRPLQQGAISAAFSHACAVAADGSVRCWGSDSQGQLGDGGTTSGVNASPVGAVALGQPARAVAANTGFTCALLIDGSVRCWGDDVSGELGDGAATTAGSSAPVGAVALGQPARAITAGGDYVCALLNDGSVRCWGRNFYGELGNGSAGSAVNDAPVAAVQLGQPAVAISAGNASTCALLADGSVRCWGYDTDGELGDGGTTDVTNATPKAAVALGQPARAISVGDAHACALLADGAVRCWGSDSLGQLGDGSATTGGSSAPVGAVALGQAATAVTAEGSFTCALLADSTIRCWGRDTYGQLGDGGTTNAINALPGGVVALGQPARAVTAGGLGACAVLADSTVRCWGYDTDGELGDGGTTAMVNAAPAGVIGMPSLGSSASADLSLTATASPPAATVGGQVVITITLANAGVDATTATIAAPLGAGLTLVSATAAQGSYSSATGLWRAGTVPAGATATLTLIAGVVSPGTLTTTAEVVDASAQDPDSTPANDIAGEDDRATATVTAAAAPAAAAAVTPAKQVAADRLTVTLKPARDAKAPFKFTPTATLRITKAALATACNGTITFTAKSGTKTVLTQRAPLHLKNGLCTATTKTTLRKRPGKATKLAYAAAFPGNAALTAIKSSPKSARIS
jgi:uncharacterized repeat protein (TIGR01451 family)